MGTMERYGVIMAGGGGTRFWPLSRQNLPKQLLNLSGGDIMINEAADRLALVCGKNLYVVTNAAQAASTRAATAGRVSPANILAEPCARNTAACIGYAAVRILKEHGDGIMVITPSDAYIRDNAGFKIALDEAVCAAEESGALVTVGIEPTFPATGYGYIKVGKKLGRANAVSAFTEKPPVEKAAEYLASGEYLWNSGMFVWKASVILKKIKKHIPALYARLSEIYSAAREEDILPEAYAAMPSVSVDYGILEKSEDILVVGGNFGWSDVGSWDMLGAIHPADKDGNITVGDATLVDCKNTTAYSSGRAVTAVGTDNLVIVETADAVMVCPRDRAQDVKKIAGRLAAEGRKELI